MIGITPFIPSDKVPGSIKDLAVDLYGKSAALEAKIRPGLRDSLVQLLRLVNSYYSNRIEGNKTLPAEVMRTQAGVDTNEELSLRDDKREIIAHIQAQLYLAQNQPEKETITQAEFLKQMHNVFFSDLPEHMRRIEFNGLQAYLVPGAFRDSDVVIGKHVPPEHEQLGTYMRWFHHAYRLDWLHGESRLIAAAAAHHRLLYIHPFLDGNGRIARLFTDEYLRLAGLGSYGIWSISRGLARNEEAYKNALARADYPRQGQSDGRGILSDRGLLDFTEFFLATCDEQLTYLGNLLDMSLFDQRLRLYCEQRAAGVGVDLQGNPLPPLRREAYSLLIEAINDGKGILRTDVPTITGLGVSTSRKLVNQLIDEGWLQGEAKQPLTLSLPYDALSSLFPHLW